MVGCIAVLLVSLGCSADRKAASIIAASNDSNIKRLANLYNSYQSRHGSQGPKDEAQFKNYIQNDMPVHRLELMQVDPNNIDGLFSSERDGQPFLVRYGVNAGSGWIVAVVFEQQGKSDGRQVAFTNGTVEMVDEARYQQLLEDPGRSSASPSPSSG